MADKSIDFKGTDGGSAITALSIDMATAGKATFLGDVAVGAGIELGHASDTTLVRSGSGDVTIEGNAIYRAGGTDVPVADGGTGASSLTDGGVLLGSGTGAVTAMAVLTDGQMIVGDGTSDPVAESGATLRTSIGLGTGDSPQFTDLTLTGDDITLTTNTVGAALIADGTNYNPVVISGDLAINSSGVAAIGSGVIVNADVSGSAAIADSKLATISTANKVSLAALDIDGADEIGAAIADSDVFVIDDGAGGTNRKVLASRIAAYTAGDATALAIALG